MQKSLEGQRDRQWKFLFVNATEEDTRLLTKDLSAQVIHTPRLENAESELKRQSVNGIFVDLAYASSEKISKLKEAGQAPVVMLADVAELPRAIEHVKQGDADAFVVKGVSDSDSVLKLMQFAAKKN